MEAWSKKGDTIHSILKRKFGKSRRILMDLVRKLNPEIEDLDSTELGDDEMARVDREPIAASERQVSDRVAGLP